MKNLLLLFYLLLSIASAQAQGSLELKANVLPLLYALLAPVCLHRVRTWLALDCVLILSHNSAGLKTRYGC